MYLNCHSYYSLRFGVLGIRELVETAKRMGCRSLALTDINAVSGVFDFMRECEEVGIRPIVGVEFKNDDHTMYIVLAKNHEGLYEINMFLSEYLQNKKDFPTKAPQFSHAFTIYPLRYFDSNNSLDAHEFIGIRSWELGKLYKYQKHPAISKTLALHTITFDDKKTYNLHRLLRAVDHNTLLSKLPKSAEAHTGETFVPIASLLESFNSYPIMLKNTAYVINACNFKFDYKENKNKQVYTTSKRADTELLKKLTLTGMEKRYHPVTKEIIHRVENELKIITQLGFTSYFLITWDIVKYAKSRDFFYVGRGSGANSIVAYCLEITNVDPVELNLYFERFINVNRTSPPDFDLDFSWLDRDEVVDYIYKRYGSDHVCMIATYSTFQYASAVRELGKVFGLPNSEIEGLVKYPERCIPNEYTKYVLTYAPMLQDVPNALSIHAGGVIISEKPIYYYTALQPMPKGVVIAQWNMYVAEDISFAKFDILSQRGLGHIRMAVDLVKANQGVIIDIQDVQKFKSDPNIKLQLQRNESMGCFYVESPAMRQLMTKLRCDNYLLLVAASSIIRPGVSASGMMDAYIKRHHSPHNIDYLHPKMAELLSETYGIMIYQEDVLKVAHGFADLDLADADSLRRGMSGKFRSKTEFERIKAKWFANCAAKGYSDELSAEVWRQVESFAGYSFSKAHSASYAVESYQSLYLKTYFPLEFMTAVVNNYGGFYKTEFYLHEAKRWGASIELPHINESMIQCTLKGKTIWLGWELIKSLNEKVIQAIMRERTLGKFKSFNDFTCRVPIGLEQLLILIKIDAFREFGIGKKELYWEAHALYHNNFKPTHYKETLFELEQEPSALPALYHDPLEDVYDQIEILDFTITSPFDLCLEPPVSTITAADFPSFLGKTIVVYGNMVTWKIIRTKNRKLMCFGYFFDLNGEFFDTTHFPQILEKYPLRGYGVYKITGKVVQEFSFHSLEVHSIEKTPIRPDPRSVSNLPLTTDTVILIH